MTVDAHVVNQSNIETTDSQGSTTTRVKLPTSYHITRNEVHMTQPHSYL
jgi:hypothetical protein